MTAVHGPNARVLLFSPAIVLLIWSLYLAINDGQSGAEMTIFFLIVTALAVMLAELIRQRNRHDD